MRCLRLNLHNDSLNVRNKTSAILRDGDTASTIVLRKGNLGGPTRRRYCAPRTAFQDEDWQLRHLPPSLLCKSIDKRPCCSARANPLCLFISLAEGRWRGTNDWTSKKAPLQTFLCPADSRCILFVPSGPRTQPKGQPQRPHPWAMKKQCLKEEPKETSVSASTPKETKAFTDRKSVV